MDIPNYQKHQIFQRQARSINRVRFEADSNTGSLYLSVSWESHIFLLSPPPPTAFLSTGNKTSQSTPQTTMSYDSDDENYKQFEIKEGIVFLIELSPAIFEPIIELELECQLAEILRCINDLMADMVITFPKNGVGIYFYNCAETGKKYPKDSGISKVFSLNDLNSSNMKLLTLVIRDHMDGFKSLPDRFPNEAKQLDNLHTVLRTVLREFQGKPQYNVKKLFWFTNDDKPYHNPELKDSLRTMISDFEDNKIWINPLFLDSFTDEQQLSRRKFDVLLYQHIFLNTNYLKKSVLAEETDPFEEGPVWLKTTLSSQIRGAIFRLKEVRRVQFACDLVLSDGAGVGGRLGCSVKGYTLYNHERIKSFRQVYTEGESLKLVHNESLLVRSDNQEVLDFSQARESSKTHTEKKSDLNVVRGYPVKLTNNEEELDGENNEKIIFLTKDSMDFMKSYSFDNAPGEEDGEKSDEEEHETPVSFSKPPYLKLLCFRDLKKFQPFFNLKPPIFITADLSDGLNSASKEGGYTNSLETFASLYQSCVKLHRYALLFGCIKKNASPNLYALYPTNTSSTRLGLADRELPEGFLLINLPWLSEVRSLPDYMLLEKGRYFYPEDKETAPAELLGIYKKLIGHFGADQPYNPAESPNPVLNYFYRIIKHEALQIDVKDENSSLEKNDWTVGKVAELREQVSGDVDTSELFKFINVYLNKVGNEEVMKRTAENNADQPRKRVKAEKLTEEAIIMLWKNDTWSKVTVPQLKEFISRYNGSIKSASKKGDMVANIVSFLELRK